MNHHDGKLLAGTLVTCGARKGLLHGPLVQMDPTGTDCRWLQHVVFNVTSEDLWSAGISHIDTGEQRRELYPLDVPLTSGAKQVWSQWAGWENSPCVYFASCCFQKLSIHMAYIGVLYNMRTCHVSGNE